MWIHRRHLKCFLNASKTTRICFQSLKIPVAMSFITQGGQLSGSHCNEWRGATWSLRFQPHTRSDQTEYERMPGFLYSPNDRTLSLWLQVTSLESTSGHNTMTVIPTSTGSLLNTRSRNKEDNGRETVSRSTSGSRCGNRSFQECHQSRR